MDGDLQRVSRLAQAGYRSEALTLVREMLHRDARYIPAWQWLAHLTTDSSEALAAIYRTLSLDPANEWARESLRALEQHNPAATRRAAPGSVSRRGITELASDPWFVPFLLVLGGVIVCITVTALSISLWPGDEGSLPFVALNPQAQESLQTQAPSGQDAPATPQAPAHEALLQPLLLPTASSPQIYTNETGLPVTVHTRIETYSIEAQNVTGIQYALQTAGPVMEDGDHSIAMTTYRIGVNWQATQVEDTCQMHDASVRLDLTYTYPRWVPVEKPPEPLYADWMAFMQHVIAHEEHHGQIALGCARDLARQAITQSEVLSCAEMDAWFEQALADLYTDCEKRQQAYDDAEGRATFPLSP